MYSRVENVPGQTVQLNRRGLKQQLQIQLCQLILYLGSSSTQLLMQDCVYA